MGLWFVVLWVLSVQYGEVDAFDWLKKPAPAPAPPQESIATILLHGETPSFEMSVVDEKFLAEAKQMELSPMDRCHFRLKATCSGLSEEQLAKLGVALFNCHSEVEGRRTYPCTEEMEGQTELREMTAASLDKLLEGHRALQLQQGALKEGQEQLDASISQNLQRLAQEKALISTGQQAPLIQDITQRMGLSLRSLWTCVMHAGYFLLSAVLLSFLKCATFSRISLLLLVPINAIAEINQQSALDLLSLTVLLFTLSLGRWFVLQALWALSKIKGQTCSTAPLSLGPPKEKTPEKQTPSTECCHASSSTPVPSFSGQPLCGVITRLGQPCKNWALVGQDYCRLHDGGHTFYSRLRNEVQNLQRLAQEKALISTGQQAPLIQDITQRMGLSLRSLWTCVMHAGYFLLSAVLLSFLKCATFSRISLLLLVPINAIAKINQQSALDLLSLTVLLFTLSLGRWFVLQALWALSKIKGQTCSTAPLSLGPPKEKTPEKQTPSTECCHASSSTPVPSFSGQPLCGVITRLGQQCKNWALVGQDYCRLHDGGHTFYSRLRNEVQNLQRLAQEKALISTGQQAPLIQDITQRMGLSLRSLWTCVMHAGYFLLSAVLLSFLKCATFSRISLLLLVPINAIAEINQQSALDLLSLTVLLFTLSLGRWFVLQALWALSKIKGQTCSTAPLSLGPPKEKTPEKQTPSTECCHASSSTPVPSAAVRRYHSARSAVQKLGSGGSGLL